MVKTCQIVAIKFTRHKKPVRITELYISGEKHKKNMADFILTNLTPFLWQRLMEVTASEAEFRARGSFRTPPPVFLRRYFYFCSEFSYCQWE